MKDQDEENVNFLLNAEADKLAELLSNMSEEDLDYTLELLDAYEKNLDQVLAKVNIALGIDDFATNLTVPKGETIH
jgi:hypothetical protein